MYELNKEIFVEYIRQIDEEYHGTLTEKEIEERAEIYFDEYTYCLKNNVVTDLLTEIAYFMPMGKIHSAEQVGSEIIAYLNMIDLYFEG